MAEITAASVKELRERTGAGMMDCKKALAENNGEMEASVDWLRAKGLAAAAKKAGRTAAEGLGYCEAQFLPLLQLLHSRHDGLFARDHPVLP